MVCKRLETSYLHESLTGGQIAAPVHGRPSAAELIGPLSLRARLLLLVAIVVTAVITTATYLQVRSFERTVELELHRTAEGAAHAVAADMGARGGALDPDDVRDTLNELMEASPALHSLSVFDTDVQTVQVLASTSSEERAESLELAREVMASGSRRTEADDRRVVVAVPFVRAGRGMAVVASVSMASVEQARNRGGQVAMGFAMPTVLLVTLLIDAVTRRVVHRPIAELQRTIRRVSAGDLTSRAAVLRRDEIGMVADGLNDMLSRLEQASDVLQQRVREATSELLVRNAELEECVQRVLGLQEALTRAERLAAVGEMAASVAHQVGTPLNLVSGYVQMIREDPQTQGAVRQRLEIVEAQLSQVTHVLRTMLDRARQPAPRTRTNLAQLVERACAIARPRLVRAGVHVNMRLDDSLPDVDANGAQLELALLNLVTNALDAMPDGGTLTIRGSATEGGARLQVEDTGAGIPADLLPHLFEPWVTTKPVGQGTGLGLGIVREVVRDHGGEVTAANCTGGGAVFTVDLPRATDSIDEPVGARV
jgi:signal transduction histidine kinase